VTDTPLTAGAIVDDPALIPDVCSADIPALLAQLTATAAALAARMPAQNDHARDAAPSPADRLLSAGEAKMLTGMSVDFLRRSSAAKPWRVRVGRELRFSHQAIQDYIRRHAGRE
jgi:hypothetical protein